MTRNKAIANSFASITYTLLIAGCGSDGGAPSTSFIQEAVNSRGQEEIYQWDNRPVIAIQDVTKTDGLMSADGTMYTADITSNIKFNMCAYKASGSALYDRYASSANCDVPPGTTTKNSFGNALFGEGYVLQINGRARFVKKESGWSLVGLSSNP